MQRLTLAAVLATLVALLVACGGGGSQSPQGPAQVQKPDPMERKAFKEAVEGLTTDELVRRFGKPDTTEDYEGYSTWNYKEVTRDAVTGKVDYVTTLEVRDGKVTKVR